MNAVERLTAAIEKLEELKRGSVPPPWNSYALDWRLIVQGDPIDDDAEIIADISRRGSAFDAELIVTLHRTIDAQLAILRAGRSSWSFFGDFAEDDVPGWAAEARALAQPLADAILGGDA